MGKTKQALRHFETLATVPDMSGWVGAGAALWAARAHSQLEHEPAAQRWLEQAAQYSYTLYDIMALTTLGRDLRFDTHHQLLTPTKLKLLVST